MPLEFTDEIHNHLVDVFERRALNEGLKGKRKIRFQAEFFCGAICAMDKINGTDKTCCPPGVMIDVMRGNLIVKREKTVSNGTETNV